MHATSAVAIAVVALNAASALAVPMGPIGEGLVYKRAPTKATVADSKDTGVTDITKAGSHAKGAAANASATTITLTVRPRPTACKAGETPSAHRKGSKSSRKGSPEKHSGEGHASHAGSNHASSTPAMVARSAGAAATPTGTSKDAASGAAPTRAPHDQHHKNGGNHQKGGAGAVFYSNTRVGKDHVATVRKFIMGTSTRCFEPTAGAGNRSKNASHKGEHKGEKPSEASESTGSTKGKKSEAKVVRRAADSHAATSTDKGTKAHEKGASNASATTTTVTVHPRPTACKAGETPSVNHKGSKGSRKGSHEKQSAEGHAAHAGSNHASSAPAVVARSAGAAATPTGTGKDAASGAAPTPAPHHHKNGDHHKGGAQAGAVFSSNTHVGKDHVTTVQKYVKGTSTRCFEPTAGAGGRSKSSSHKGGRKGGKLADSTTTHKSGTGSQSASSKTDTTKPDDAKLVARAAADIFERFFSELDELD